MSPSFFLYKINTNTNTYTNTGNGYYCNNLIPLIPTRGEWMYWSGLYGWMQFKHELLSTQKQIYPLKWPHLRNGSIYSPYVCSIIVLNLVLLARWFTFFFPQLRWIRCQLRANFEVELEESCSQFMVVTQSNVLFLYG